MHGPPTRKFNRRSVVSFGAVISVVTQRFSLGGGEALRDDPNNGCEEDYNLGQIVLENVKNVKL